VNEALDHARSLAEALEAVREALEQRVDLDLLLRALDLGDRLERLAELDDPGHAAAVAEAREDRADLVAALALLVDEETEWEPLDRLGEAMARGEHAEERRQWGMALLRLANAVPALPAAARPGAVAVLRRAVDELERAPGAFLPLTGLAADRVALEDPAAQPPLVRRLLDHMLALPFARAAERAAEGEPVRLDLVRRVLGAQPVQRPGGGLVVPLRARAAEGARLAADDGRRAEPPAGDWRTAWSSEAGAVSLAEVLDAEGRSRVLLSVVLGPGAPAGAALDAPGAVELVGADGQPLTRGWASARDEWRAWLGGDQEVALRVPLLGLELPLAFERPDPGA
jgi:hypothetical protein